MVAMTFHQENAFHEGFFLGLETNKSHTELDLDCMVDG